MRNPVLCLLLCLLGAVPAFAQFGLSGKYQNYSNGYWHTTFESVGGNLNDQVTSISGMYWFRLKSKRVEFLPEIGYFASLKRRLDGTVPNQVRGVFFQFNTDFYFLDFGSDCNCPTFSKQNDVVKRGLFLEVSPGVELRKLDLDYVRDNMLETKTFNNTVPRVYLGLGLDFGLSDLVTVTPTVGTVFAFSTGWEGVEEFIGADPPDDAGRNHDMSLGAGIRILFRPDYTRRRR